MLLIVAVYGVARWAARGQVMGSVTVLDVELGGVTPEVATEALTGLEERLANLPATAIVEGRQVDILPAQTGLDLDEESMVEAAMAVGRSSNPVSDFIWWITHFAGSTDIPPQGSIDPDALDALLENFDASIIGEPPFEGAVELVDGELVARYPRPGRRIDREAAASLLIDNFLGLERPRWSSP